MSGLAPRFGSSMDETDLHDLARHWQSRTRNGGPIELSAEERSGLLSWASSRMDAYIIGARATESPWSRESLAEWIALDLDVDEDVALAICDAADAAALDLPGPDGVRCLIWRWAMGDSCEACGSIGHQSDIPWSDDRVPCEACEGECRVKSEFTDAELVTMLGWVRRTVEKYACGPLWVDLAKRLGGLDAAAQLIGHVVGGSLASSVARSLCEKAVAFK